MQEPENKKTKNIILLLLTVLYLMFVVLCMYQNFSLDFSNKSFILTNDIEYEHYFHTGHFIFRTFAKFFIFIPLCMFYTYLFPTLKGFKLFILIGILILIVLKIILLSIVILDIFNLAIYIIGPTVYYYLYMSFFKKHH